MKRRPQQVAFFSYDSAVIKVAGRLIRFNHIHFNCIGRIGKSRFLLG